MAGQISVADSCVFWINAARSRKGNVKSQARRPSHPTGRQQEDDRRKSREAGFDSHVVKPIDCQQLVGLIESFTPAH
jgi:hypothetical protein